MVTFLCTFQQCLLQGRRGSGSAPPCRICNALKPKTESKPSDEAYVQGVLWPGAPQNARSSATAVSGSGCAARVLGTWHVQALLGWGLWARAWIRVALPGADFNSTCVLHKAPGAFCGKGILHFFRPSSRARWQS